MTTHNEAAERLYALFGPDVVLEAEVSAEIERIKAEGAREAVERIWARLLNLPDGVAEGQLSDRAVFAILTEELSGRESSLGRDTEGHLVLTLGPGAESPSRKEGWERYDGMSPLEQREADGDR